MWTFTSGWVAGFIGGNHEDGELKCPIPSPQSLFTIWTEHSLPHFSWDLRHAVIILKSITFPVLGFSRFFVQTKKQPSLFLGENESATHFFSGAHLWDEACHFLRQHLRCLGAQFFTLPISSHGTSNDGGNVSQFVVREAAEGLLYKAQKKVWEKETEGGVGCIGVSIDLIICRGWRCVLKYCSSYGYQQLPKGVAVVLKSWFLKGCRYGTR